MTERTLLKLAPYATILLVVAIAAMTYTSIHKTEVHKQELVIETELHKQEVEITQEEKSERGHWLWGRWGDPVKEDSKEREH